MTEELRTDELEEIAGQIAEDEPIEGIDDLPEARDGDIAGDVDEEAETP